MERVRTIRQVRELLKTMQPAEAGTRIWLFGRTLWIQYCDNLTKTKTFHRLLKQDAEARAKDDGQAVCPASLKPDRREQSSNLFGGEQ